MSIQKTKLKNGTHVYKVCEYIGYASNGNTQRTKRTFSTLQDAKTHQARVRANKAAMRNKTGRITLADYVAGVWWQSLTSLTPATRATYEKELRLRILPALGGMNIADIQREDIQRMVDGCNTQGVARKATQTLRTILGEARADGLITNNPASARFRLPSKTRKRDNAQVVTRFENMAQYFNAAQAYGATTNTDTMLKLMITGFLLGLRPEERYGLNWSHFDAQLTQVHILQAYTNSSKREGGCHLKPPKTQNSRRIVPVPAPARAMLEQLPRTQGAFLLGANNKRLTPSTAQKRCARFYAWCACNGYELAHVTIENMRHSFATSYLHAGGNVEDLSRILGHTDINTTYKRYVRPSVEDLARGMNNLVRLNF